jgi:hypothetical protein
MASPGPHQWAAFSPAVGYTATVGNISPNRYQFAFETAGNVWTASNQSGTSRPCIQKSSSAGASRLKSAKYTRHSTCRCSGIPSLSRAYLCSCFPRQKLFSSKTLSKIACQAPKLSNSITQK